MKHPGGRKSTDATLHARFLYTDDGLMADPSVVGLTHPERLQLVSTALVEMRDQGEHWSPRRLAGFVRRLRNAPPGSEASQHTDDQAEIDAARELRMKAKALEAAEIRRLNEGGPTRVQITPKGAA